MTQFMAAQSFYENQGFKRIPKEALPNNFLYNTFDTIFFVKYLTNFI
ncbi:MAG: hypothetical protein ACJARX_001469 [Psychroserpens sp.]|jgi:hypothetical protein